jgi:hypothetical protein
MDEQTVFSLHKFSLASLNFAGATVIQKKINAQKKPRREIYFSHHSGFAGEEEVLTALEFFERISTAHLIN